MMTVKDFTPAYQKIVVSNLEGFLDDDFIIILSFQLQSSLL